MDTSNQATYKASVTAAVIESENRLGSSDDLKVEGEAIEVKDLTLKPKAVSYRNRVSIDEGMEGVKPSVTQRDAKTERGEDKTFLKCKRQLDKVKRNVADFAFYYPSVQECLEEFQYLQNAPNPQYNK